MDTLQFAIIAENWAALLEGLGVTIGISFLSFIIALLIGICVGVIRHCNFFGHKLLGFYVEFFRGTPLLIQLFFIYYGLPSLGIPLPRLAVAYLGLGLNGGAYISEIIRSGLRAIPQGQYEAAFSLGLTKIQTLYHIIIPQALRIVLPTLVNAFSGLLKDSSLISVLAITEITRIGQLIYTRTFKAFEVYLAIAICYFILTYMVSCLSAHLEKKFKYQF